MTGTIDIKKSLDTIKKKKEYKETLDITLKVNAMGEKLEASLNAVSNVKKISSVDSINTKSAINIEEMSSEEASKFLNEVENSSSYEFIESFANGLSLPYTSYTKKSNNLMVDEYSYTH